MKSALVGSIIGMLALSEAYPSGTSPNVLFSRDKKCNDHSIENRTGDQAPLASDCLVMAKNWAGGGTWQKFPMDTSSRQIGSYGSCAFNIKLHGTKDEFPTIGNEDVISMINDAVNQYANGGKNSEHVAAGGLAFCGGTTWAWDMALTKGTIASPAPDSDKPGYAPGKCHMHIVQWQKNEKDTKFKNYAFTLEIKDNDGNQIGSIDKVQTDDNGKLSVGSKLPLTVEILANGNDDADVQFKYGDQSWSCGREALKDKNRQCSMGSPKSHDGYDSGARQGEADFNCPAK